MSLWLSVRRLAWCAITAIAVIALVVAIGGVVVPVPALGAFEDAVWPIALIAPVALAVVLAWSLGAGEPRLEAMAVRPMAGLDMGFVICITVGTALAAAVAGYAGWAELGGEVARNTVGYVGLMLVGRAIVTGDAAAVLPVAYVVLAAFFGGSTASSSEWWAWLVKPAGDALSWVLAVGLFGTGLTLGLR